MQILVPISGHSPFFPKAEFYFPKPLIEIAGSSMIELVINQLQSDIPSAKFIFVADSDDLRSFSLGETIKLITSSPSIVLEKPASTRGGLCSCLLAIDELDDDQPLIIANSDQIIEHFVPQAISSFVNCNVNAGVLTFDSVHPRWSYVLDDGNMQVLQAFEKSVKSRNAIAGLYYFKRSSEFIAAAQKAIINNDHHAGSYYISTTLNQIILSGGLVKHYPIPSKYFHSFYSPSKINEFELSCSNSKLNDIQFEKPYVNVIIPAAGQGSRFAKAGWKKPKPFIDVNGKPMIEHVIQNVSPKTGGVSLILRESHIKEYVSLVDNLKSKVDRVIDIKALTEGTACTVLTARKSFNNSQPMIIANSDQLVDFDINSYIDDCISRQLDGSILVFRDPTKDPKWSFVKLDNSGLVVQVAEKDPISDLATVGIYMFTKGIDFLDAALEMILANDRVNNEFYTCPVYNYLIKNGARIGVYEVPFDSMVGLGTPDDLNNYLENVHSTISTDFPSA